jgi:hypothetical protein
MSDSKFCDLAQGFFAIIQVIQDLYKDAMRQNMIDIFNNGNWYN